VSQENVRTATTIVLLIGMTFSAAAHATAVRERETAGSAAIKDPCDVAAAVLAAAGRRQNESQSDRWSVVVEASCGQPLRRLPAVVRMSPGNRELLGWGAACPVGPSGPRAAAGRRVEYYDIAVMVRDSETLTFQAVPHYVDFDKDGNKKADVMRGCAETGRLSLNRQARQEVQAREEDLPLAATQPVAGRKFEYWADRELHGSRKCETPESQFRGIAPELRGVVVFSRDGRTVEVTPASKGATAVSLQGHRNHDGTVLYQSLSSSFLTLRVAINGEMINAELTFLGSGVCVASRTRGELRPAGAGKW